MTVVILLGKETSRPAEEEEKGGSRGCGVPCGCATVGPHGQWIVFAAGMSKSRSSWNVE